VSPLHITTSLNCASEDTSILPIGKPIDFFDNTIQLLHSLSHMSFFVCSVFLRIYNMSSFASVAWWCRRKTLDCKVQATCTSRVRFPLEATCEEASNSVKVGVVTSQASSSVTNRTHTHTHMFFDAYEVLYSTKVRIEVTKVMQSLKDKKLGKIQGVKFPLLSNSWQSYKMENWGHLTCGRSSGSKTALNPGGPIPTCFWLLTVV
jgi:hypothetical protein